MCFCTLFRCLELHMYTCRQASHHDKLGKWYRNVPNVFSIADEDDAHDIGKADMQLSDACYVQ